MSVTDGMWGLGMYCMKPSPQNPPPDSLTAIITSCFIRAYKWDKWTLLNTRKQINHQHQDSNGSNLGNKQLLSVVLYSLSKNFTAFIVFIIRVFTFVLHSNAQTCAHTHTLKPLFLSLCDGKDMIHDTY